MAELFKTARECGVITVLDVVIPEPADYDPFLGPVLPWTDVFLPNNDEGQIITGRADPLDQAEAFRKSGAKTVVVTCGGNGAVLVDGTARLRADAQRVLFVDGTGSGDAFVAGFIYGLLSDASASECLRYGSALGASCVRETGATKGVFNADELAEFLASRPLSIETL